MTSTLTAETSPRAARGCGPTSAQATNVRAATTSTAGVKIAAIRSASRSMGARRSWASRTSRAIRATSESPAVARASIVTAPAPLIAPPITRSPGAFATGSGSPVRSDSSQVVSPSRTTPSVGTRPPGRTRSRSPTRTAASGTVEIAPSEPSRSAVGGARSMSERIAADVPRRARPSSTWPSSTSTTIMPADSKKTSTLPSDRRNASGKMPGATVAMVLAPQATSTPSVMSENIVGRPARKPAMPPDRMGQPPQKTIGVARRSWSQLPPRPVRPRRANQSAILWPPVQAGSRWPSIGPIASTSRVSPSAVQMASRGHSRGAAASSRAQQGFGAVAAVSRGGSGGSMTVSCSMH